MVKQITATCSASAKAIEGSIANITSFSECSVNVSGSATLNDNDDIDEITNKFKSELLIGAEKEALSQAQQKAFCQAKELASQVEKYYMFKAKNMMKNCELKHNKINTIVICCDELIAWHNLPCSLTSKLPGYNKFKKISVEFTNIHNNRQICSASRSTMLSSIINTGIQDNIDLIFQWLYIPELNPEYDTIGKVLKRNDYDIIGYYGKSHVDSKLAPKRSLKPLLNVPSFNTNSRFCLRKYGFDIYNTFGDTYYYPNHGYFTDQMIYDFKINNSNKEVDYVDIEGEKYIGVIPFLKARFEDGKSFHMQCQFQNPHDTTQFYQNYSQTPLNQQLQFTSPFLYEQTSKVGINNPYFFDVTYPDAFIQEDNLTKNYFEYIFFRYSKNITSLPFVNSYTLDYSTSPKTNSPFAFYTGLSEAYKILFSFPNNSTDIASWKNLINNYYGLVHEVDNYISSIYDFLEKHDMFKNTAVIITSDHGDQMSGHGLKQKGVPYKESVNVPFMVYSPDLSPGTSNILGSLIDLCPTIETISHADITSDEFKGVSLLNSVNNKLKVRCSNQAVFNIFNSFQTYNSYFTFIRWYSKQTTDVQNSMKYSYRNKFFEYFGHYSMCIHKINSIQYKLVRFYSIKEVIAYNLLFNKLLNDNFIIDVILNEVEKDTNVTSLINSDNLNEFKNILNNYKSKNGTFNEIYDYITQNTNNNDSIALVLFISFIINYIEKNTNYNLLIPGCKIKFDNIYKDPNYYFFLYNMTEDNDEIINLLDKNFPERQTSDVINIFKKMNEKLNKIIPNYCDKDGLFTYLLPREVIIFGILRTLTTYGVDYSSYTDSQINDAITSFQQNNWDN